MDVLLPESAGKFIADNSKDVTIDEKAIEVLGHKLIDTIKSGGITKSKYCSTTLHPKPTDHSVFDWIFVIDTLNFCFWSPNKGTENDNRSETAWKVNGEAGYFGLCAAIVRAIKDDIDILNPKCYSKMTKSELANIFRSDDKITPIPLLEERMNCLHEVGEVLINKYDSTFLNCVKDADGSAMKLLNIITDNFKCFRDEAKFNGKRVAFYKRAQILVADVWSCFEQFNFNEIIPNGVKHSEDVDVPVTKKAKLENGVIEDLSKYVAFYDIDKITMFADYRVPQCLKYFDVLKYSDKLIDILNKQKVLDVGSRYEIEIRGCCIHAIELLKQWLKKNYPCETKKVNSVLLDQYLWEYRREVENEMKKVPFHRVISIYY